MSDVVKQALERLEESARQVGRLEHRNQQLEELVSKLEHARDGWMFIKNALHDLRFHNRVYNGRFKELWKNKSRSAKESGEMGALAETLNLTNRFERALASHVEEDDWGRWVALFHDGEVWRLMTEELFECPEVARRWLERHVAARQAADPSLDPERFQIVAVIMPPRPPPA